MALAAKDRLRSARWRALDEALVRWWNECNGASMGENLVRSTIRRFMRWCSVRRIAPEKVSERTIATFVSSRSFRRKPERRYFESTLRRRWNVAVSEVPGWPPVRLRQPLYRHERPNQRGGHIISFNEHQFHPDLVAEVRRFCDAGGFLGDAVALDPRKTSHRERLEERIKRFDAGALPRPARALRPLAQETLYQSTRVIYLTATALHLAGEAEIGQLRNIADVLTATGAALLADSFERRLGGDKAKVNAAKCLRYFHSIAARCALVFTPAERDALRCLKDDLAARNCQTSGISERNLEKLMQFDDVRKFAMLVALPQVVMRELEASRRVKGRVDCADAQAAWRAIGIELLNTLPLRRNTVIRLDLARNFVRPKGAKPKLVVFADQEKNGKLLESRLSQRTWRMIALYRRHYRPRLPGAKHTSYLFPAKRGHITGQGFAAGITHLVKARLGVQMSPHLWRHLMSSKLGEATGRAEDAEKLLGHTAGSAATKLYVRLRTRTAAEQLGEILAQIRRQGAALLRANGRRSAQSRITRRPTRSRAPRRLHAAYGDKS